MVELENHSKLSVAKTLFVSSGQVVDPLVVVVDLATIGCVKRTHQVQQGALARTGRANDGCEITRRDRQIDAL